MGGILSGTFRWLAWNVATLVLILAILVGWAWLGGELKRTDDLHRDRVAQLAERERLAREVQELTREADARARRVLAAARSSEKVLAAKRAERDALRAKHPLARNVPLSEAWQRIQLLEKEVEILEGIVAAEARAAEKMAQGANATLAYSQQKLTDVSRSLAGIDDDIGKSFVGRTAGVVREQLPVALAIFAGILLLPIAIDLFLYFVVAPLATRRPPIRLLPEASGNVASIAGVDGRTSGVSVPTVLGEHEELLIQSEYLQSTAVGARKNTKWLLNGAIPLSSLLSGMYLLTRVGPSGQEPVVVSATQDAHSEVGIIDLAEGAAFVCQPRSLAGVIQDSRRPIRITRHWRLGTLQSWLTLQLRFLVFHGPGKLILKGGRGIRVEAPGGGRLINQAATLGFSANLAYATTRCETFISYWRGKEDLFNDLFTGENGIYVYEEVPDPQRTAGIGGRGLRGFADTILKLFGV